MEVPYHYQFRVIVIGDTMVGKSSLLKTFSEGSFGEMEPTVGVDFFSKIVTIKPKYEGARAKQNRGNNSTTLSNRIEDNIIVKLQIWDTAGQERFKSIVTSYYRNSVGIVLVYDVTNRESYEHLIDWFDEARRHVEPTHSPSLSSLTQHTPRRLNGINHPISSTPNASSFPNQSKSKSGTSDTSSVSHNSSSGNSSRLNINDTSDISFNSSSHRKSKQQVQPDSYTMAYLVLGCKTDLQSQRQVSFEDGKAFADTYGFKFIETSSKTRRNVDQAFQLLAEEIYDKIIECGRLNRLYRTASGGHLTFDAQSSYVNEGIRIGPLIGTSSNKRFDNGNGVRLLEAQPVSGYLGGCC